MLILYVRNVFILEIFYGLIKFIFSERMVWNKFELINTRLIYKMLCEYLIVFKEVVFILICNMYINKNIFLNIK